MSIESAIATLLLADTNVGDTGAADYLTGGILAKKGIGKMGIDKNNPLTPDAYEIVSGFPVLQPLVVVKLRSLIPVFYADVSSQTRGARGTLELWFYDDNHYDTIIQARDRIRVLLDMKTIAGVGVLTLDNRLEDLRAEELNKAALLRDDYTITRKIGA